MAMKRMLPYGSSNFEEIATGEYFYVDKTGFIERLERVKFPVFLRPRRFGKSLLAEMLRCYYDLRMAARFEAVFGGLDAGRAPTPSRNRFYFLKLDFSGMYAYAEMDERELKRSFDRHVAGALLGFLHHYRHELAEAASDVERLKGALHEDAASAMGAVCELVAGLGGQIYLAIDEYDSLANALAVRYRHSGRDDNMYLRILGRGGFFRNFFELLKAQTGSAIHQIYMTGILPITISDMKSGFNIASWVQLDERFSSLLGITGPELDCLLDEVYSDYPEIPHGKAEVAETLRNYYDGYRFTKRGPHVYNPMMVLYFLDSLSGQGSFPDILADNNLRISYQQIAFLFGQNLARASEIITEIADKKAYDIFTPLKISFDMVDFKEGNHIAEGLFYAGILTHSDQVNTLRVPNLVTYDFALDYFNKLRDFHYQGGDYALWVGAYKRQGDAVALVEGFFRDVVQKYPGQFFSGVNESFYHGLFFQVLYNHTEKDIYELLPEYNLARGRADIMLRTYPGQSYAPMPLHDLFELKQVPKEASDARFEARFEECRRQVAAYRSGDHAHFRAIAVCFRGNTDVKVEILPQP